MLTENLRYIRSLREHYTTKEEIVKEIKRYRQELSEENGSEEDVFFAETIITCLDTLLEDIDPMSYEDILAIDTSRELDYNDIPPEEFL